ncbi:LCP family protein [Mobilitalea sibirica]|uniref:LCP family protein n=1 Tax=Mobilitalea sibirica TaxID=1462919 RepID=A0A8J7H9D1_9FIRM|nr:LCP family protein [Mobilitalea sibirica]MBH1941000.1 LCP family protein [Mobilitalea sibirica]
MQDKRDEERLKQQVIDIMNEDRLINEQENLPNPQKAGTRKKKNHPVLKTVGIIAASLLIIILLIVGTKGGRNILYGMAGKFIYSNVNNEEIIKDYEEKGGSNLEDKALRQEAYVTNYLIFGIEEFGGARNTDSMMIASVNSKDKSIKLTSLLRDSYVEIPGYKPNKLNSAYAKGGARLLVDTIELNYKVKIEGYVSVNFNAFENIVDLLGGVSIELGKEEAKYLNKTNYISKKSNRNVKPGVNNLNGNQVMGYVRVRKVKTLGGANNDYGRVVRQQRALAAIFDSYISTKNIFKILPLTKECLGYVTTNLTQDQIEKAMATVVENRISTLDTFRIPVDGAFDAPKKYNGVGYPLVLDWEENRIELYQFLYNDTKEEAIEALASLDQ